MRELEKDKAFKLRDRVTEEVIDRAKAFVIEAKGLRENAILKYFENRVSQSRKLFLEIAGKKPPQFSDEQIEDNQRFIEGFKNENLSDPDLFKRGSENLKNINKGLDKFDENLKKLEHEFTFFDQLKTKKGREAFRQEMETKANNIKAVAAEFNPERIDGILAALDHKRKQDELGELDYKSWTRH